MPCIILIIYTIGFSNNTILIVKKKRNIVNLSQCHLCHYLYLQNQTPQTQTPSLQPYQSFTHPSHTAPLHQQVPVFCHLPILEFAEDLVHLPP